jgi:protein-disulfide isomerase
MKDMRVVFSRPVAATLALIWLIGSVSLIAFFREEAQPQTNTAAAAVPAAPVETLDEAQIAEWHAWLDRQERVSDVAPTGDTKVLFVKFNDFQCPSCRSTWLAYKDVIAKYEEKYPGAFKFELRDFPLEGECGSGGGHMAACEGAAAVRMARDHNQGPQMEAWLYDHQAEMTRDSIKSALQKIANVSGDEYDAKYAAVLEKVRADSQFGSKLGVNGTPTFYLNGIKIPGSVRAAYLDEAFMYELRKAGVS